jgi:chemotaxis protein histidine kinase CheA
MKNKKAMTYLLTLGMLLLALAVLSGSRPLPKELFSAQTSGTVDTENSSELERIANETTPLAGPTAAAPQTIQLVAQQEPVAEEPVAKEPAPEEPVAEEPVEEEPAPEEPAPEEPVAEEPTPEEPVEEEPTPEEPAEEEPPVVSLSAAQKLLERSYALLTQYNACTTMEEKRVLLGASNYSLGNDALRTKLLADMGGSWEQLEEEVTDATEYQQDKTLYVQVYMSGSSSDFTPVIYTAPNPDRSGNQWATNLVYIEDEATWMEYVKKHPYNDSRVAYYVTGLAPEGSWETLQETMETSDLWQEVELEEAPAEDSAPLAETDPALG